MAVSSRIFGIKVNKKKTDCFSPLADMLNHKRPRQTQWYYSDEHGGFLIQSLQDIEKGEQVITYLNKGL
jgi:histone-lysine N-methyltransferase SETD3